MRKKGENIVQFKNHQRQMPAPLVIYADFEAITERYKDVSQIRTNHIQTNIKNIQAVVMVTK